MRFGSGGDYLWLEDAGLGSELSCRAAGTWGLSWWVCCNPCDLGHACSGGLVPADVMEDIATSPHATTRSC